MLARVLSDEAPLFGEVREVILRKCHQERQAYVRPIFEQQAFGELERMVTQRVLEVLQSVAKEQLENDYWLRMVADLSGRTFEEMRVIVLEFLDTDVFNLSREQCVSFLDPMIESWDIDLATFALDITLNSRVVSEPIKRFEFVEREAGEILREPGFDGFLQDRALSGTATDDEIGFLSRLKFKGKRPTPLYYYRELQGLRDPLHFRTE